MLACVDVSYSAATARAACVSFAAWTDREAAHEIVCEIADVAPYQPGEFFRRELPCLLAALSHLAAMPSVVIVDGYVWLSAEGNPGLGAHLHEALGGAAAVVGVAKTVFLGAPAIPITRGSSRTPLYVSSIGMAQEDAAAHIRSMSGEFRIPTLLKRVDRLSRG